MHDFKFDVFLSYASEDEEWCEELANRLTKESVRVWFAKWELQPGDNLLARLNEGLQNSRKMVAVWSKNFFKDDNVWTLTESFSQQHLDVLSSGRPLIPLLIEKCEISPTLRNIITIDFLNDEDFELKLCQLIEALDLSREEKEIDAKVSKTGISGAVYLAKIKKPSSEIKRIMKEVITITEIEQLAKLLEKAVGASHDIERWAKVIKDSVRLNAVVQVHTKSARLLMQGAQWDGSDETVFIFCHKWLNCAMRTINENSLSETLDELRGAFYTLYIERIPYLVAKDQKREANVLKNHYVGLFGNEDGFLAEVDKAVKNRNHG